MPAVRLRDGDELGPGAVAIYADALCVRTKMTATSEAIPAMTAGNVTFADDEIAFGKTFHVIANAIDHPDELVPDGHRNGDRLLGPSVPVIYMYVRAADGRFKDADEDVVAGNFGHGDFLQPQSGLGFRLYHGLHRFLHGVIVSADFADSHRLSEAVSQFNLRKSV
jgi:hypothetical protein